MEKGVYVSDQARKKGRTTSKRKYEQARINLGDTVEEWEAQKNVCGGSHANFAKHLLQIHRTYCSNYCGAKALEKSKNLSLASCSGHHTHDHSSTLQHSMNQSSDSSFIFPDFVPETPERRNQRSESKPALVDLEMALMSSFTGEKHPGSPLHASTPVKKPRNEGGAFFPHLSCSPLVEEGLAAQTHLFDSGDDASVDSDAENMESPEWVLREQLESSCYTQLKSTIMSPQEIVQEAKCIAFNKCLTDLVKLSVGKCCKSCQSLLNFHETKRGTCLVVVWQCPFWTKEKQAGHSHGAWASQPRVHYQYAGNLLVPAAVLLSGNSYEKMAMFARFLNLGFLGHANHHRIENKYCAPAIEDLWTKEKQRSLDLSQKPLVICGDGRNDSPGHCASYLTYVLMDYTTKRIISLQVVHALETELKSTLLEKVGFVRAIQEVQNSAPVSEVITDAHPQIKCLLKKDPTFAEVDHQLDNWHFIKNMTKKVAEASQMKDCAVIRHWISAFRNHMWWCAENCDGNEEKLMELWKTILPHVTNRHVWVETGEWTSGKCKHPMPVEDPKRPWVEVGSRAHKELIKIVYDKKLTSNFKYIRKFRHTSHIEAFNSHLLMYCPKRFAFSYKGYRMRNMLAALDHNFHVNRPVHTTNDDQTRYHTKYSKATKRWRVQPRKTPKSYAYIPSLLEDVIAYRGVSYKYQRLDSPDLKHRDDPKKDRASIGTFPKPSKASLIAQYDEHR